MRKKHIIARFISDICTAFPEVRPRINAIPQSMPVARVEEFARETTRAFETGDLARGRAYLAFMAQRLNKANPVEYEYIDVYYVENLFWPHGSEAARLGWPWVPENLKALFLEFHRKPPL